MLNLTVRGIFPNKHLVAVGAKQADNMCILAHTLKFFLARELNKENLMTNRDFVLASLALPKPIRNSLIHRLIFVMWFVPF